MRKLTEIETVVDALPAGEKQELLLFLAARLRAEAGSTPEPRKFTPEQIHAWITEDEKGLKQARDVGTK